MICPFATPLRAINPLPPLTSPKNFTTTTNIRYSQPHPLTLFHTPPPQNINEYNTSHTNLHNSKQMHGRGRERERERERGRIEVPGKFLYRGERLRRRRLHPISVRSSCRRLVLLDWGGPSACRLTVKYLYAILGQPNPKSACAFL
mgnify:CR=1 FL=1